MSRADSSPIIRTILGKDGKTRLPHESGRQEKKFDEASCRRYCRNHITARNLGV